MQGNGVLQAEGISLEKTSQVHGRFLHSLCSVEMTYRFFLGSYLLKETND